jgi:hypothetical protein
MKESTLRGGLTAGFTVFFIAVQAVRVTLFSILATFEPVVRISLSLLAMGGFAMCGLHYFVIHSPHFPLGLMFAVSSGFSLSLVLYYLVLRALAP